MGKDENVSGPKEKKSQEQLECERLCEQIYRETTEFVAQANHLAGFIQAGRKLLNGPPLYNTPVLFIGYQPGGGVDARQQHIAAETHWPEVFEYLLVGQEPLWTAIQNFFPKMDGEREFSFLKCCVGMNAIFFRSRNVALWKQIPLAFRRELEKHSRERSIRFIDAIQPQKIVVNGRGTYKFLGGKLDGNPDSLPQAMSGSIEDIPAIVSYHLSGARMSTKTREAVKQRIREVSGYNQYLNNR
jgi:hypothetical protein